MSDYITKRNVKQNKNSRSGGNRNGMRSMPGKAKSKRMGHSDINLTRQIYTHIRSERKEDTAAKLNAFDF